MVFGCTASCSGVVGGECCGVVGGVVYTLIGGDTGEVGGELDVGWVNVSVGDISGMSGGTGSSSSTNRPGPDVSPFLGMSQAKVRP